MRDPRSIKRLLLLITCATASTITGAAACSIGNVPGTVTTSGDGITSAGFNCSASSGGFYGPSTDANSGGWFAAGWTPASENVVVFSVSALTGGFGAAISASANITLDADFSTPGPVRPGIVEVQGFQDGDDSIVFGSVSGRCTKNVCTDPVSTASIMLGTTIDLTATADANFNGEPAARPTTTWCFSKRTAPLLFRYPIPAGCL